MNRIIIKALLILLFAAPYFSLAQSSGLVGAWHFQGNANDESGNGNNATLAGGASIVSNEGRPNTVLLDGIDDYVEIPYNTLFNFGSGDFTIAFWVKKISGTSAWDNGMGVNKCDADGNTQWHLALSSNGGDNKPGFWFVSGASTYNVFATTDIILSRWYHLAAQKSGDKLKIYVNGILEGTTILPSSNLSVNNTASSILIGKYPLGHNTNAYYDDVNIYNTALNDMEVMSLSERYPVSWTELVNMTVNADNSLTKSGGTTAWDASAISHNRLSANQDGWLEFNAQPSSADAIIGLSEFGTEASYLTIRYGIYFIKANNNAYIYENGANVASLGISTQGETFRISREGSTVKYYRNSTVEPTPSVRDWVFQAIFKEIKTYNL